MSSPTQTTPIKVGFVGLSSKGWAATALGPALIQPSLCEKYSLVAISTTNEASAKASAQRWSKETGEPIESYSSSLDLLQGSPDIDLAIVSVTAGQHKSVSLPFIQAGKDIFIEWPVGQSTSDTNEIAAEIKKHGARSLIGLQARQSLVLKKVKEIIASGKIGRVLSTNFIALMPREFKGWAPEANQGSEKYLKKSYGVTPLSIVAGHGLDPFTHLLGEFKTISPTGVTHYPTAAILDPTTGEATGTTIPTDVGPDHISITGILASGALATITWKFGVRALTPGRSKLLWEIEGEEGTIRMESNEFAGGLLNQVEPQLSVNGEKVEVEGSDEGLVGLLRRNFEEYAKGDDEGIYPTIDDAVKLHELLDAIEEALETGRRVDL